MSNYNTNLHQWFFMSIQSEVIRSNLIELYILSFCHISYDDCKSYLDRSFNRFNAFTVGMGGTVRCYARDH